MFKMYVLNGNALTLDSRSPRTSLLEEQSFNFSQAGEMCLSEFMWWEKTVEESMMFILYDLKTFWSQA